MDIIIRNKWISLGGSSYVKDINDNDMYKVKGRIFTFTRKKFLKTMDGKLLYVIRNKFWRLFVRRAYVIDSNNEKVATVRRKIFSLHDRYFIENSKLGNLEIMGNILGYDYQITLNGNVIGHVARRISLRDSFVLSIADNVDYAFYTALVIAIDNITDAIRNDSN